MAITKIREIRSTLDKAIRYICNPEKTKGMLLVDSFRCFPETAAAQMELTASFGTGLGNRKAYHLIQSFDPDDDITPEKALEIGKQYAQLVTGGRYEYVIATHNDGKHIHNHIIFNAVSFEDYRKYHHGKKDVQRIMDLSDQLCRENHLSVIESTSGRKGKNHEEYQSGNSWRERLADLIDTAVLESQSFEEFQEKLELEGVTVKQGKHIAFRCELLGQERSCRGKSIGPGYTEEAIRARIARDEKYLSENRLKSPEEMRTWKEGRMARTHTEAKGRKSIFSEIENSKKINVLVDTWKGDEAGKRPFYANKMQKINIDNFVKFTKFMADNNIQNVQDLLAMEEALRKEIWTKQHNLNSTVVKMKQNGEIDNAWILSAQNEIKESKELLLKTRNVRTIYEQAYGEINTLQESSTDNFVKFMNFMERHNLKNADDLVSYERSQRKQISVSQTALNAKILQRKELQNKYDSIRKYIQFKQSDHQIEVAKFLKAEAYLKSIGIYEVKGSMLRDILINELMPINEDIKKLRSKVFLQKEELQKTATVRIIYEQTFGEKLEVDEGNSATVSKKKDDIQR